MASTLNWNGNTFDGGTDTNKLGFPGLVKMAASKDKGEYVPHVKLVGPTTAFGELQVAEKTPQIQMKFPNGIIPAVTQTLTNKAGSTVTTSNGVCTVTVAGTAEAFSQIRSMDVIRYGPGQGMDSRFTAAFSTGLADSSLWAGPGDDDEMLAFGYDGTSFGILHRKFGELEVRSITFTQGGDAGGGTFTLTLDGTAVTITVPSGSATIADVCALVVAASADIFNAGRGWKVYSSDSKTVFFISLVAENATGTFSFADVDSGVTAGTFNQATTVLEGVAPTETITPQAEWNVDVMDGTGPSGATLAAGNGGTGEGVMDINNLNVYDIDFQYLGAGDIFCSIEDKETGNFNIVHVMKHAGAGTAATFRNPTFHMNIIAKTEAGFSGAAQTVSCASMAGFIEGKETATGIRESAKGTKSTNGTTDVCVLYLHNPAVFNGTRNKVQVFPDHITLINDATKPVLISVIYNPTHIDDGVTLSAVDSSNSVMEHGSPGGTYQGGREVIDFALSASSSKDIEIGHLGEKLRPTDRLAIIATKESGGADGDVTVGLSWLERI